MNKHQKYLDPKYLKIALYAGFTAIIAFFIILLLLHIGPAAAKFGTLALAVLKPLIIGGILCYLFYPFVEKLDKRLESRFSKKKWIHTISVLVCIVTTAAIILAFLSILLITMSKSLSGIELSAISNLYDNTKTEYSAFMEQIRHFLENQGIDFSGLGKKFLASLSGFVSTAASLLSALFFGIIFSIYFLLDGKNISRYWKRAAGILIPKKALRFLKELLQDADHCFSGYIRGQVIDAALVGASVSILFTIIGMPYAILIGIITGVGNLIPYFGPILGYASVIIVNVLQFNPKMLILGLIILIVIMFIDANLINPRLLAGTIEVHPLLVVTSLLAGSAIGGILGMLISVPCGAFLKLQFDKYLMYRKSKKETLDPQEQA